VTEWDQILREDWYSREEPEGVVVDFARRLKEKKHGLRVLDLGCGAGRHTVYLAGQGFEVHGADSSRTGLELTRKRLKTHDLRGQVLKCDMKWLPYVDSCFDTVVCLHAIYHQNPAGIRRTISEITRLLRKGGFLLVNFLSTRTYSYGRGVKVGKDTFVGQEGVEKGVMHHFVDEREIRNFFRRLTILRLNLSERSVEGKFQSRWTVELVKDRL
jgi:ubiquinone/menaquinone biosynthesis C-methylase UbiE